MLLLVLDLYVLPLDLDLWPENMKLVQRLLMDMPFRIVGALLPWLIDMLMPMLLALLLVLSKQLSHLLQLLTLHLL